MGIETKEHIDALFSGENLTEEFKEQAKAIFEAAVQSKVDEHKAQLDEQMSEALEQNTQELTEALVSKIDDYLDYVINEWMEENKVAIEGGLKAELAEDFMVGLKNLFAEHYISIPDEKVDVVEGMAEKVEELQQDLDAVISERAELIDQLNAHKMQQIVFEVSENLSEVQMAKLQSLAENIEFVSENDYKEKLLLTKRKYFESKESEDSVSTKTQSLDSEESLDESFSPVMSHYVQSISRNVKK